MSTSTSFISRTLLARTTTFARQPLRSKTSNLPSTRFFHSTPAAMVSTPSLRTYTYLSPTTVTTPLTRLAVGHQSRRFHSLSLPLPQESLRQGQHRRRARLRAWPYHRCPRSCKCRIYHPSASGDAWEEHTMFYGTVWTAPEIRKPSTPSSSFEPIHRSSCTGTYRSIANISSSPPAAPRSTFPATSPAPTSSKSSMARSSLSQSTMPSS